MKKLLFTLIFSMSIFLISAQTLQMSVGFGWRDGSNNFLVVLNFPNGTAPYTSHIVINYVAQGGLYEIPVCDTTYVFSSNGLINSDTSRWYTPPATGQYQITIRSSDATGDTSFDYLLQYFTADTTTGIADESSPKSNAWYYNKYLTWKNVDEGSMMQVINVLGQTLVSKTIESTDGQTDLSGLKSGIYLALFKKGETVISRKFQVN